MDFQEDLARTSTDAQNFALVASINSALLSLDTEGTGRLTLEALESSWHAEEGRESASASEDRINATLDKKRKQVKKVGKSEEELRDRLHFLVGEWEELQTIFTLADSSNQGSVQIDQLTQSILLYKKDRQQFLTCNMLARIAELQARDQAGAAERKEVLKKLDEIASHFCP